LVISPSRMRRSPMRIEVAAGAAIESAGSAG
jgi:hypothetical protein